jgi:uncharacterized protein YidB (DUF937 family)
MNDLLGGAGGLGGLIDLLGGGGTATKSTSKTTSKSRSKSGKSAGNSDAIAQLLPAVLGMLGGAGGLAAIIAGFQSGGLGDIIGSWIGSGPNKRVTQTQVKKGLGKEKIAKLASDSGLPESEVTKQLTTLLPALVNQVTPQGSVPAPSALDMALRGLQSLLPKS